MRLGTGQLALRTSICTYGWTTHSTKVQYIGSAPSESLTPHGTGNIGWIGIAISGNGFAIRYRHVTTYRILLASEWLTMP